MTSLHLHTLSTRENWPPAGGAIFIARGGSAAVDDRVRRGSLVTLTRSSVDSVWLIAAIISRARSLSCRNELRAGYGPSSRGGCLSGDGVIFAVSFIWLESRRFEMGIVQVFHLRKLLENGGFSLCFGAGGLWRHRMLRSWHDLCEGHACFIALSVS